MPGPDSETGTIDADVLVEGRLKIDQRIDRAVVGSLRGQDLSGFEVWQWLGKARAAEELLTEAELYPTLYRLEADGIIESHWQESERIRRKYRLTATGLGVANSRGWPAQVIHERDGIDHPARVHSPDPDAGSWFVPPKEDVSPVEANEKSGPAESGEASAAQAGTGEPPQPAPDDAPAISWRTDSGPVEPAFARFQAQLHAAVDLPKVEADRVSQEIGDHLADSAHALQQSGVAHSDAVARAVAGLGDCRTLAANIDAAEHSRKRWRRGLRRGLFELAADLILWLALAGGLIMAAPGLAQAVMALTGFAGVHLSVIASAEWTTNQVAAMLCVGAFAAGRVSLGQLARISRHRDDTLRPRWAVTGGIVVLVVALLLPGVHDWFDVATFFAAPVAFALGTFHPRHSNETAYTWPGMLAGVLLVAGLTFFPGVRLFFVDLNGTPGAPAAPGAPTVRIDISEVPNSNIYQYGVAGSGSGDYQVEFWPTQLSGLSVIVDPAATQPTILGVTDADLSKLAPDRPVWVVAVQTLPDGRRQAAAVDIQPGFAPPPQPMLTWLLGHL